jgi:hypothetical protein
MSQAQEIWNSYKSLFASKDFEKWGKLWAIDGRFVVVYGREKFGDEMYCGREEIVSFFSDSPDKTNVYFENDVVYETKNPNVFFVTFDFTALVLSSQKQHQNRIICQFEIDDQGKIKELIEYADPNKRAALFRELSGASPLQVNLEKRADILQQTFEHYYRMAMDHHAKAATTSNILLIIVAALIGFIGMDNKLGGSLDILSGFAVSIIGLFGVVWSWKQQERYEFWEQIAYKYQEALVNIVPLNPATAYYACAKESTAKKFGPHFAEIHDRVLWVALHFFIVLIGIGLMLA